MSASGITIRPASPSDAQRWRELFTAYGVFYETAFDERVLDGVWAWILDPEHPVTAFLAETDGAVVGFAHMRSHPDTFVAGPGWFLDDLFADPSHRGSGVGTALLEAVAAHAAENGGGTLRWITAADNERAQHVYDRLATRTTWVTYEKETSR
ncbi:MAG: GNAT family N-acetyltransferase [Microcella sp.]|uniref:GNAT family N-acetyltransferase n=1 Tax=Microcella sp. TaxID=1913979 RepID=UPI0033159BB1